MSLILNGTTGISDVDGTAAAPALTGTDSNTGIFFPAADTIAFAEGGAEAMRITNAGNVGIGTSSPTANLDVRSATGQAGIVCAGSSERGNVNVATGQADGAGVVVGSFVFLGGPSTVTSETRTAGIFSITEGATSGDRGGNLQFTTKVNGGSLSERMRIDSSGNLLVGRTSLIGTEKFGLDTSGSNQAQIIRSNNTSGNPQLFRIASGQFSGTIGTGRFITCDDGGTDKFIVAGSGNVTNANNSYGSISDVKLKENIVDTTPKLADLMQVKVRNYNLIGSTTKQIGVVAQELEIVFPAMIDESPDRDEEGNELSTKTKAVKYSVFVPILIKAIQEQQALITSLTARIAALEGAA